MTPAFCVAGGVTALDVAAPVQRGGPGKAAGRFPVAKRSLAPRGAGGIFAGLLVFMLAMGMGAGYRTNASAEARRGKDAPAGNRSRIPPSPPARWFELTSKTATISFVPTSLEALPMGRCVQFLRSAQPSGARSLGSSARRVDQAPTQALGPKKQGPRQTD